MRGLQGIHKKFQLRKLQLPHTDEVFVLTAAVAYVINSTALKFGNILGYCFSCGDDSKGSDMRDNVARGGGIVLVSVITLALENIQCSVFVVHICALVLVLGR